jgi:opacity protein-like surface antigen
LNPKWSAALQLGYNWNSRNTDFDPSLVGLNSPPSGADTENSLLLDSKEFAEERNTNFQGLNTNLSSIGLNMLMSYKVDRNISVFLGPGLELYTDRTGLEFQILDNSAMQTGHWITINAPLWVSSAMIGLSYNVTGRIGLSMDYRRAFNAFDSTEFTHLDTDKIRLSLSYRI